MAFSGALIEISGNEASTGHYWFNQGPKNAAATLLTDVYYTAPFNTPVYDVGGWLDAAQSRLVVPAGVSYVRVIASAVWMGTPGGIRQLVIAKNGQFCKGIGPDNLVPVPYTTTDHVAVSHPLQVEEGDFFTVHPFYQGASQTLCLLKSTGTCFSIEAIG